MTPSESSKGSTPPVRDSPTCVLGKFAFSTSATPRPSRTSLDARADPAGPAPITQTSNISGKVFRSAGSQPYICFQGVVEPPPNVVASWAAAFDHFMVTTAAAEISSPTVRARRLQVHVPIAQPAGLGGRINSLPHVTKKCIVILHESM